MIRVLRRYLPLAPLVIRPSILHHLYSELVTQYVYTNFTYRRWDKR